MTDTPGDDLLTVPTDDVPKSSPLAGLRKRIEAAREQATVDFDVYVDEGLTMVFRYRALGFDELDRVQEQVRRTKNKNANVNKQGASLLAWANVGVFVKADDGTLGSIDPESDCHVDPDTDLVVGDPVTISSTRMAELIGLEQPSALDVLKALVPKELMIARMITVVTEHSSGEDSGDALGN